MRDEQTMLPGLGKEPSRPQEGPTKLMRAISLWQPWATLIRKGMKTIETRMWPTKVRGDVLICSTKSPRTPGHLCGYALCIVKIVDCRLMTLADEDAAQCEWDPGRYAWVLEDIRPIEPFRVSGKQGFFGVEYPPGRQTEQREV